MKLSESKLRSIVKQELKSVLNEGFFDFFKSEPKNYEEAKQKAIKALTKENDQQYLKLAKEFESINKEYVQLKQEIAPLANDCLWEYKNCETYRNTKNKLSLIEHQHKKISGELEQYLNNKMKELYPNLDDITAKGNQAKARQDAIDSMPSKRIHQVGRTWKYS